MFIRRGAAAAIALVVLLWAAPASAHEEEKTTVLLDVGDDTVAGKIELPLALLNATLQPGVTGEADLAQDGRIERLRAYFANHLEAAGKDGAPWNVEFGAFSFASHEAAPYLDVPFTLKPPSGTVSDFTLSYDALLELFPTHQIIVSAGPADGERRVAGILTGGKTSISLDERGYTSAGFWTMVHHGFDHVGDGADHLLFLLVLLLPAPLIAAAGRWQPGASGWRTLRQIVHVVTAFTLGHSITLVASVLDWVEVPSRPVEILIAVSVGAGAVHAIRPLVGHREALIAGLFGLVHGLAFAGILDDLGLGRGTALGALFGFNIGIELAQLAAVTLVFPSLYAMSRTRWYPFVRIGGAGVALVAATAWVGDRASWVTNPLQGIEDAAVDNPFAIAGALAVLAAATLTIEWRAAPTRTAD